MSCRAKASSILSSVMATIAMSLITSTTHSTTTFTTTKSKIRPSDGPINTHIHTDTIVKWSQSSWITEGKVGEALDTLLKTTTKLLNIDFSWSPSVSHSILKPNTVFIKAENMDWLTLKPTLTHRHHLSSLAHSSGFSSQPRNILPRWFKKKMYMLRETFRQKKLCFAPYFWSLWLASSICPLMSYYSLKHKQTCRFTWLEKQNKTQLNLYSLSLSLRKYSWKLLW